jgi:hypothetical protein
MRINQTGTTTGEKMLYEKIKEGRVTATYGNTDKGTGWRPVAKGRYLGNACLATESQAITYGNRFLADLKTRIEGIKQLPMKHPAPKRTRKSKAVQK